MGKCCCKIYRQTSNTAKLYNQNDWLFFFSKKLFPIYCELNQLKLSNIYELEVLKFVYKFRAKLLPNFFADYFPSAPEIHMPTRFSKSNNLALPTFYTSAAQRSIRYQGCKIWNELPAEIKSKNQINYRTFLKGAIKSESLFIS